MCHCSRVNQLEETESVYISKSTFPLPSWAEPAPPRTPVIDVTDDIPILPDSGVVQAAVFWTIASERARITP